MNWTNTVSIEAHENSFNSEIVIPEDSQWFSGHFPKEPVFPGIAQLACVVDTIKHFDPSFVMKGFNRVKFKSMIKPGDTLNISCSLKQNDYLFKVTCKDIIACSGVIKSK